VIGAWEQILFGHLKTLMSCSTTFAKQDLNRIFVANAGLTYRNKIIAHRVQTQIQDGLDILISANFAKTNLNNIVIHLNIHQLKSYVTT
jgi:hypothetical protein